MQLIFEGNARVLAESAVAARTSALTLALPIGLLSTGRKTSWGRVTAIISGWGMLRARSVMSRTTFVVGVALLSAACANQSYMGISLVPGRASAELQDLARRAQSGNKQAQLDLGIRYEEGIGINRDLNVARRLYTAAAHSTKHAIFIYLPPVRAGGSGTVLPTMVSPPDQGLAAARERLVNIAGQRPSK